MASKRMFTNEVLYSETFLGLSLQRQMLYMHLCMSADDEGFVKSPYRIAQMIGAAKPWIQQLVDLNYLILFNSKVALITHWFQHNYNAASKIKPTSCTAEKELVFLDKDKVYCLKNSTNQFEPSANLQQISCTVESSVEESRKEEISSGKCSVGETTKAAPEKQPFCESVFLSEAEHTQLCTHYGTERTEKLIICLARWKATGKNCPNDYIALTTWVPQRLEREETPPNAAKPQGATVKSAQARHSLGSIQHNTDAPTETLEEMRRRLEAAFEPNKNPPSPEIGEDGDETYFLR